MHKVITSYDWFWHVGAIGLVDNSSADHGVTKVFVEGEFDTQLTTTNSLKLTPQITTHKGKNELRLHGWISSAYLKFEPSTALEVRFDVEDKEFLVLINWRLSAALEEPCPVKLSQRQIVSDDVELQQCIHELFAFVTLKQL